MSELLGRRVLSFSIIVGIGENSQGKKRKKAWNMQTS